MTLTRRSLGAVLVAALVGPLAFAALKLADISSLPLGDYPKLILTLVAPGLLCGWIAPPRWRIAAALPTALVFAAMGNHSGYLAPFVIPGLFLCALVASVLGGLLSKLVRIEALPALAATLLVLLGVVAYLGFRDRVFFILRESSAAERSGYDDGVLFAPGPFGRCLGLIAIAGRRAAASRGDEAASLFDEALRNASLTGMNREGMTEDIVRAEVKDGLYDRAERDFPTRAGEQDRLWFFGNEYLRAGQFARVEAIAAKLTKPDRRFYLTHELAMAEIEAHQRALAHATIQELFPLAAAAGNDLRFGYYSGIAYALMRDDAEDEARDVLLGHALERLPDAAKDAENDGRPAFAQNLRDLAADAGIWVDRYGTAHTQIAKQGLVPAGH